MYDVIILGSGPAGLTAAIYTTRAALKTLVIAGEKWGGQLMLTTDVENFPGFPEGIQGPDLMAAMRKQAEHHGAEIVDLKFEGGDMGKGPFTVKTAEQTYETKSVIIATGEDTKWLGVPGELEKIGRGVSSCAPCDAPFFRNKKVIVAGGGDSAMEEACVLTRFASEVTIVHRRNETRASQAMLKKAQENPKIKFLLNTQITEIVGEPTVKGVKLKNNETNEETEMAIDGVFVAIGHIPNTKMFAGIELDDKGYVKKYEKFATNVEGIFVAGDVHDHVYRQAVTAAGFGCAAALETEWWLASKE